jgi:nucleoside-diphosphate-sugar epimerase
MNAASDQIKIRSSYNLAGTSFTPAEIALEIKKQIPEFNIDYLPDFRQAIASSWPESIDDSQAREDWGWKNHFDLTSITNDMLIHLRERKRLGILA